MLHILWMIIKFILILIGIILGLILLAGLITGVVFLNIYFGGKFAILNYFY
mgnify:CR=1 FL=1